MNAATLEAAFDAAIEAAVERAVAKAFAQFAKPTQSAADVQWLNCSEAAAFIGVHERTIRKFVRSEGLPTHRVGKLYRFERAALQKWLNDRRSRGDR